MIIEGKTLSLEIKNKVKNEILELKEKENKVPKLAVILVGNNPASIIYIRNKIKACEYVGIKSIVINYDDIEENELISKIKELNNDVSVSGILVQLPLPKHINDKKIMEAIAPEKDVDGFHPQNIAKLIINSKCLLPCTPQGIIYMIESVTSLDGKNVLIIGRSNIVGKPVALMCLHKNATVTIAHSHTRNLKELSKKADIVISAIGKPKFLTKDYFSENSIIIDVGINRDENNKLCGDVDFDNIKNFVQAITPVPGGVGPMTIAMLMHNTLEAFKSNNY